MFKPRITFISLLVIVSMLWNLLDVKILHAAPTTYYVDCSASTNGNGTSSSTPWNNLSSVNAVTFGAGDTIRFKRNTDCNGMLTPTGSGTSGSPITITSSGYGSGALPRINGGSNPQALKLFNQQYWVIEQMETTGGSNCGLFIGGDSTVATTLSYFRILNTVVRDVSGVASSKESGLVCIFTKTLTQLFNDVLIDGVTAYNTRQWAGIRVGGFNGGRENSPRSTNVTIRNSVVHDIGGDGIIVFEAENVTIANNVAYNISHCNTYFCSNYIDNRDFEESTTYWTTISGTATIDTSTYALGKRSLRIGNGSGAAEQPLTSSKVLSNAQYTIGGYGVVSTSGERGYVGVKGGNSGGQTFDWAVEYTATYWLQNFTTFTTPAGTTWMTVYVSKPNGSGKFNADRLVLKLTSTYPKPLNPNFESGLNNWENWGNSTTDTANAKSGTALKIGTGTGGITQDVDGGQFTVSAWGKADAGQTGWIGIQGGSQPGVVSFNQGVSFTSSTYAYKSVTVSTPDNLTWIKAYIWKDTTGGNFYADEISVVSHIGTPNGIWQWRCKNCVVEYNEAYNTGSWDVDGGAFDIDWGTIDNTVQYNYGHDADAYCMAVFGAGSVTSNAVIRYNVCANNSRNSALAYLGDVITFSWTVFGVAGSIDGAQIYNNTFYRNPVIDSPVLVNWSDYSGSKPNFFKNNLIYAVAPSSPTFIDTTSASMSLNNNLYWTTASGTPAWRYNNVTYSGFASYKSGSGQDAQGKNVDPLLNTPTYHGVGRPSTQFTLQSGSPARDAGANVCSGISGCSQGAKDFFGNPIPGNGAFDIGAHEYLINLITNPGFETAVYTPWSNYPVSVTDVVAGSDARTGTYAARIIGSNAGFYTRRGQKPMF